MEPLLIAAEPRQGRRGSAAWARALLINPDAQNSVAVLGGGVVRRRLGRADKEGSELLSHGLQLLLHVIAESSGVMHMRSDNEVGYFACT